MKAKELIELAFNTFSKKEAIKRTLEYIEELEASHKLEIETTKTACEIANKLVLNVCMEAISNKKKVKPKGFATGGVVIKNDEPIFNRNQIDKLRKEAIDLYARRVKEERIQYKDIITSLSEISPYTYDEIKKVYNHFKSYDKTISTIEKAMKNGFTLDFYICVDNWIKT